MRVQEQYQEQEEEDILVNLLPCTVARCRDLPVRRIQRWKVEVSTPGICPPVPRVGTITSPEVQVMFRTATVWQVMVSPVLYLLEVPKEVRLLYLHPSTPG